MTTKHLSIPALLLLACAGEGEVEVRAWGEDYIEQGIPADVFADGWAVSFDRFEVTLQDVFVAGSRLADPQPVDLTEPSDGEGQLLGRAPTDAGDHQDARFTLAKLEVEGTATRDQQQLHFAWTFETPVHFHDCETTTTVPTDGVGSLQITIHADHLFYDSLVAEEPLLLFDAIAAADLDGDGDITQAELAQVDIGGYDPGNAAIDDLAGYIAALARTTGHVDGEGHCASE
jgi:hypothetical protein